MVATATADVTMAAIFSDHAVLQQKETLPVWGWAEPGEEVTISIAQQSQKVKAAADGSWRVDLTKMDAGGPHTLTAKGRNTVTINDILIGEVWLGSGQSNMAFSVGQSNHAAQEISSANFPQIRMFHELSKGSKTPQRDAKGKWEICSPSTVGKFSATLYFFGREIHQATKMPVGLIHSSVGGTAIQLWISPSAHEKMPASQREAVIPPPTPNASPQPKKKGVAKKAPSQDGFLFNAKIAPLVPYAIKGVVWYQGEANTHPGAGFAYRYQLPALINDWRQQWKKELPFIWVQLPQYNRPGNGWCLVREAMLQSLKIPNTGMAITADLGNPTDIHPKDKQPVGHRLALWALHHVYGKDVPATSGPLPAKHEIRDASIVVTFTHAEGLQAKGGGELKGFLMAGEDKVWHPAQAKIEGQTIIATCPNVARPLALRYSWSAVPDGNLFNQANLPASPFRTDTWDVQ